MVLPAVQLLLCQTDGLKQRRVVMQMVRMALMMVLMVLMVLRRWRARSAPQTTAGTQQQRWSSTWLGSASLRK
jgi:hypothetical protein